jgi:hypothetical protein
VPRPCCVPSRSAALRPPRELVAECVRLDAEGALIRTRGHFASKPIASARFTATIGETRLQFDAERVKQYLSTGRWRPLPKRRKGGGYVSKEANQLADQRLLAVVAEFPTLGVRKLAELVGVSHPCISRRISRLKQVGIVARVDGEWQVERPVATQCERWVPELRIRRPGLDEDCSLTRYG